MDYIKGLNNFTDKFSSITNLKDLKELYHKELKTCVDARERKEVRNLKQSREVVIEEIANRTYKIGKEKIERGSETNTR